MYWPLLNMYSENFGFGPGGFFIRGTILIRGRDYLFMLPHIGEPTFSCVWEPVTRRTALSHQDEEGDLLLYYHYEYSFYYYFSCYSYYFYYDCHYYSHDYYYY